MDAFYETATLLGVSSPLRGSDPNKLRPNRIGGALIETSTPQKT
jgi:hypothetical protein